MLDYLEDLESDFSAFHRVDDIFALDGPRFMRMAVRVFAYDGVMAARAAAESEKSRPSAPSPPQKQGKSTGTGWQTVSLEEASPHLRGERREVRRG